MASPTPTADLPHDPLDDYEPTEDELDRFVLTKKEEAGIRYKVEKHAFAECFYLTEKYAQCVKGRWFSVVQCRDDLKRVDQCLANVASPDYFEDQRRDFIRSQLKARFRQQQQARSSSDAPAS